MKNRFTEISLPKAARIAGWLYLMIIISGILAEFFIRQSLIVPGDAAATAANVSASGGLFRLGIAADLVMIICDVALAVLFYLLLKPVNKTFAMLAAFFRLTQAAVLAVNLLNLFFVLQLLGGANYLAVFGPEQLQGLVLFFFQAHGTGYAVGLVFFGIQCLLLGYLIYRSGYFPRILGVLLMVAGIGYLTDSFARVLLANYAVHENIFSLVVFLPAFIGEMALCLWLIIRGKTIPEEIEAI
jgi:hypothetical protein